MPRGRSASPARRSGRSNAGTPAKRLVETFDPTHASGVTQASPRGRSPARAAPRTPVHSLPPPPQHHGTPPVLKNKMWAAAWDDATGNWYYHHLETEEVQWQPPQGPRGRPRKDGGRSPSPASRRKKPPPSPAGKPPRPRSPKASRSRSPSPKAQRSPQSVTVSADFYAEEDEEEQADAGAAEGGSTPIAVLVAVAVLAMAFSQFGA